MNQRLLAFGVFLLVVGIVSIASSSIGINCYNNSPDEKEAKKSNFNFLVLNLVLAIALTFASAGFLYLVVAYPSLASGYVSGL